MGIWADSSSKCRLHDDHLVKVKFPCSFYSLGVASIMKAASINAASIGLGIYFNPIDTLESRLEWSLMVPMFWPIADSQAGRNLWCALGACTPTLISKYNKILLGDVINFVDIYYFW